MDVLVRYNKIAEGGFEFGSISHASTGLWVPQSLMSPSGTPSYPTPLLGALNKQLFLKLFIFSPDLQDSFVKAQGKAATPLNESEQIFKPLNKYNATIKTYDIQIKESKFKE